MATATHPNNAQPHAEAILPDPWLIAKNRFLADLDDDEASLFKEATLENIYYSASNTERDDRKSKARKAISKLQPLVSAIEDYGKALDVFANVSQDFLTPIWGSIRVVLILAGKYGRFYEEIVETLERIGDILPRFRDYQKIFDPIKHMRLTESISKAYVDIITICYQFRHTILEQKRSKFKRLLSPLSSTGERDEILRQFRNHRKNVEKEAENCHMIEAAEARALVLLDKERIEREKKAERKRLLLSYLCSLDIEFKHVAMRKIRHPGTGSWALASVEYQEWLRLNKSTLLSCYGIPGSGKSVLVSSIIDSLRASNMPNLLYHYCDYADKRTLDPIVLVGSLIRQLLTPLELSADLENSISRICGDGHRAPDLSSLTGILISSIKQAAEDRQITCIIDGLDELPEDDRLRVCKTLQLVVGTNQVVKILLSGREDSGHTISIPNADAAKFRIQVIPENISSDIDSYIKYTVRQSLDNKTLVLRDPTLEETIVEALTSGAKGMFLWVKFQIDNLCDSETDSQILDVLQNLPKDLSETYDRLLTRITSQQVGFIRRMFQWIICAKRPLTLGELQEGIAFDIDDLYWDWSKIPTSMPRLIRACSNLIVVDEESRIVRLAHYTVQQYLLESTSAGSATWHFDIEKAEVNIAETCLAYLCFSDFERQITKYVDDISPNMERIEAFSAANIMHSDSPITNTALQVRKFLHGGKSNLPKSRIDYSRYLHAIKKAGERENVLMQQYQLLSYAMANWAAHGKFLTLYSHANYRVLKLFQDLVFEKDLILDIQPWKKVASQPHITAQVMVTGWAIDTDNSAFLFMLQEFVPEGSLFNALCKSFACPDAKGNPDPILLFTLQSWDLLHPKILPFNVIIDRNCLVVDWIRRKVFDAFTRGNLDVITTLLSCSKINSQVYSASYDAIRSFILRYMLMKGAQHGHEGLVKTAHLHLGQYGPLCRIPYQSDNLDALEVSAIHGQINVLKYLFEQGYLTAKREYQESRAVFRFLTFEAAFKDGNVDVMVCTSLIFFQKFPGFAAAVGKAFCAREHADQVPVISRYLNAITSLSLHGNFEGFDYVQAEKFLDDIFSGPLMGQGSVFISNSLTNGLQFPSYQVIMFHENVFEALNCHLPDYLEALLVETKFNNLTTNSQQKLQNTYGLAFQKVIENAIEWEHITALFLAKEWQFDIPFYDPQLLRKGLLVAAGGGYIETVRAFLDHERQFLKVPTFKPNLDIKPLTPHEEECILCDAVEGGHILIVQMLLDHEHYFYSQGACQDMRISFPGRKSTFQDPTCYQCCISKAVIVGSVEAFRILLKTILNDLKVKLQVDPVGRLTANLNDRLVARQSKLFNLITAVENITSLPAPESLLGSLDLSNVENGVFLHEAKLRIEELDFRTATLRHREAIRRIHGPLKIPPETIIIDRRACFLLAVRSGKSELLEGLFCHFGTECRELNMPNLAFHLLQIAWQNNHPAVLDSLLKRYLNKRYSWGDGRLIGDSYGYVYSIGQLLSLKLLSEGNNFGLYNNVDHVLEDHIRRLSYTKAGS